MSGAQRPIPVGAEPPPMKSVPPRRPAPDCGERAAKPKHIAGGRFAVLNHFVDVTLRSIDPAATVVWLVLFRDTKPDGLARASQADLARRLGRSVRTVYSALRQLEARGLLVVVRRGRLNTGASVYRVRALGSGDA